MYLRVPYPSVPLKRKKNLYLPSAVLIAQRLVGPYRNTYIYLEIRLSVKRYLFEFICHSLFASISNPCRKKGVNFFLVRQSVKVTCIRRKNGQPSKIFVMHKSWESLACSSSVFEWSTVIALHRPGWLPRINLTTNNELLNTSCWQRSGVAFQMSISKFLPPIGKTLHG